METSANGWPLLTEAQTKRWVIPELDWDVPLRRSHAGFVLVHVAYTVHKTVESLEKNGRDEWGWSPRFISGTRVPSNHWSGTAIDLNSITHPFGSHGTFTKAKQITKLQWMLSTKYQRMVTWGGNWRTPDDMHFEINTTPLRVKGLANELRKTPWGKLILDANN